MATRVPRSSPQIVTVPQMSLFTAGNRARRLCTLFDSVKTGPGRNSFDGARLLDRKKIHHRGSEAQR